MDIDDEDDADDSDYVAVLDVTRTKAAFPLQPIGEERVPLGSDSDAEEVPLAQVVSLKMESPVGPLPLPRTFLFKRERSKPSTSVENSSISTPFVDLSTRSSSTGLPPRRTPSSGTPTTPSRIVIPSSSSPERVVVPETSSTSSSNIIVNHQQPALTINARKDPDELNTAPQPKTTTASQPNPTDPPRPVIRRVRLILGPRPPTPSSSSSACSSRSTSRSSSPARRVSGAVDDYWLGLGWDSDESELTPLEDSGESEASLSESDDDEDVDESAHNPAGLGSAGTPSAFPSKRSTRKVSAGAPLPPKKHRWQCVSTFCANLLQPHHKFRRCNKCRNLQQLALRARDLVAEGKLDCEDFDVRAFIPCLSLPRS